MGIASVLQVYQSSGCSHDNLYAFLQSSHLRLDGGSSIDGLNMYALHVFREVAHIVGYLYTKLAGWTQHQSLGVATAGVDTLQQRYAKGCRLACSCLSQSDGVSAALQQSRYYFLLHRHGLHKSHFLNGAPYMTAYAQLFKCLHSQLFIGELSPCEHKSTQILPICQIFCCKITENFQFYIRLFGIISYLCHKNRKRYGDNTEFR